jgi:hypothetical protein
VWKILSDVWHSLVYNKKARARVRAGGLHSFASLTALVAPRFVPGLSRAPIA